MLLNIKNCVLKFSSILNFFLHKYMYVYIYTFFVFLKPVVSLKMYGFLIVWLGHLLAFLPCLSISFSPNMLFYLSAFLYTNNFFLVFLPSKLLPPFYSFRPGTGSNDEYSFKTKNKNLKKYKLRNDKKYPPKIPS